MKRSLICILSILFILIGLIITFYPEISDFVNRRNQSFVIEEYGQYVSKMPISEKDEEMAKADAYNEELYKISDIRRAKAKYTAGELKDYYSILN